MNDPKTLARMLELDEDQSDPIPAPRDRDLRQMFAHQLAAPLAAELKLKPSQLEREGAAPGNFSALFQMPSPPQWLLEDVKSFAKTNRASTDPAIQQIATALYYASIAAALVRLDRRISEFDDKQLRDGFRWALDQQWLDDPTRQLFTSAINKVAGN